MNENTKNLNVGEGGEEEGEVIGGGESKYYKKRYSGMPY